MIPTTLCLLIKENGILLAMKKRGFGAGKWNGVGGKIKNETVRTAAIREMQEEISVTAEENDLEHTAELDFYFGDHPEWNTHTSVFIVRAWRGEPTESEEMRPAWYTFDAIPYSEMWVDDKYWLPLVLEGKKIKASFYFSENGGVVDNCIIEEKTSLSWPTTSTS